MTPEQNMRLRKLMELYDAATPGKLDTAEIKEDGCYECPHCHGNGEVDGVQYVNYDGAACNVMFSGIGPEFLANEAFYTAILSDFPALAREVLTQQALIGVLAEARLDDERNEP